MKLQEVKLLIKYGMTVTANGVSVLQCIASLLSLDCSFQVYSSMTNTDLLKPTITYSLASRL